MNFLKISRSRLPLLLVSVLLILIPLLSYSCGGDFDDTQADLQALQSCDVLISAATLNSWITNGYGTDEFGFNKMVILEVNGRNAYSNGHVPGAYILDISLHLTNTGNDGVSDTISQVATKAQMDDLMQSTGIDAGTVIVLTGTSNRILQMSRAYFNFRYWGFPRCRLKMLDGFSEDYEAWVKANVDAGFTLETTAPSPAPRSSYSVCELTQNTSLRAPLEEMIDVAEDDDDNTVVIDARRIDEYDGNLGSTPGSCETASEVVAFEGHIRTALSQPHADLLSGSGGLFISKADLTTAMTSIGVDSSKATYVYCVIGFRASALFFVLDAVLRWPAKIYDGSWKEWGQMAPPNLDTASQWRTDTPARSGIVNYNTAATCSIDANSLAFHADGVNQTDSTICGGDGDGDGPPIVPGY